MDQVPTYLLTEVVPTVAALFCKNDRALLAHARVISMSDQILTEIVETAGIHFENSPAIIPGWVDGHDLVPRVKYLEQGRLRLMAAGSLGLHKGTDIIIDACSQLLANGYSAFHVDIYGFGTAEPWVSRAAQCGATTHVRFHGPRTQQEIMALLPQYDAFVFPTQNREPFGFAPVEAAACGAVPIITRTAGCAERLVDGVHALKIDRTPESLAAAIARMLTGEVDVAKLGRRATRLALTELSFDRCLKDIENVLNVAAHGWHPGLLDDPRLPALLFAKHLLGQYLTVRR
jgi:glycosyltransferase involved in cell wall biosynthesis